MSVLARVKWLLIRALVVPTLAVNRLMCLLGLWHAWDGIDDSVLLGSRPSCRDITRLHELGVSAIVNLCEEFAGHGAAMQRLGIQQLRLPTLDYHSPTIGDLRKGLAFIDRVVARGGRVYLHCKAGRGRAATLAIAYVARTYGVDVREAERRVRRARPQIDRGLVGRKALREI